MPHGIEVTNVAKSYRHVQAIHSLTFNVEKGEIFGLLGANGAGKSTLIKILIGILSQDAGTVSVLGLNPQKRRFDVRQQVGYMPQSPALYEDLTARDNIRFFGRAFHLDNLEKHIDEVLDFTDLRERGDNVVEGFSGGMKQRVSLACALVHQPKILLLDEPGAGVDPLLRDHFWKHFRELAAQGVTILVSTHQMDEAVHCDRIAIMRQGDLLACNTPRKLLDRANSTIRIHTATGVMENNSPNKAYELPRLLREYGLSADVEQIEIIEPTLENVVLDLISEKAGA